MGRLKRAGWVALLSIAVGAPLPAQTANPAVRGQQAGRAMAEGRFADAAAIYAELLPLAPDDPGLLINLGMALHLSGQDSRALEPLSKAAKLAPDAFPAQLFLGASRLRLGNLEAAADPLEKAAKLDPKHVPVRQMLGDAYSELGLHSKALVHRNKLVELAPRDPMPWAVLGQTYEHLAQEAFARLDETDPESAYMLRLVGDVRFSAQQYVSAFYLYRKALERKPGWRGLHAAIAEVYRRTDRADWAAKEQKKEDALPPRDCAADPIECDFANGRFSEAAQKASALKTPEGFYWQAQAYNRLASDSFERLEKLPESVELHATRARVYASREDHSQSAEQWRRALQLEPGDPAFEAELAIELYKARKYEDAKPRIEKLRREQPSDAQWPLLLGDILLAGQQVDKALPLLQQAVKLDPSLLPAQHALGRAYMQLGQDAKAAPHLKLALELDQDGSLHYQLARAYQTLGDREAARPLLKKYQQMQQAQRERRQETLDEVRITAPDEAP